MLDQDGIGFPPGGIEVTVVGKLYGPGGGSDLVGLILEETESRGREIIPWPIESTDPARPITLRAV